MRNLLVGVSKYFVLLIPPLIASYLVAGWIVASGKGVPWQGEFKKCDKCDKEATHFIKGAERAYYEVYRSGEPVGRSYINALDAVTDHFYCDDHSKYNFLFFFVVCFLIGLSIWMISLHKIGLDSLSPKEWKMTPQ